MEVTTNKSKTFQQGDNYGELIEWFMKQIETNDYQPEGTDWSCGEPSPHDPVCELKAKYRIIVIKIETHGSREAREKPYVRLF